MGFRGQYSGLRWVSVGPPLFTGWFRSAATPLLSPSRASMGLHCRLVGPQMFPPYSGSCWWVSLSSGGFPQRVHLQPSVLVFISSTATRVTLYAIAATFLSYPPSLVRGYCGLLWVPNSAIIGGIQSIGGIPPSMHQKAFGFDLSTSSQLVFWIQLWMLTKRSSPPPF